MNWKLYLILRIQFLNCGTWQVHYKKKNILKPQNWHKQVTNSLQNRHKSCLWQHRVHPAAPMVLQGGPKVPTWPPKVLPRWQNGPPRCSRGAKICSQIVHQAPKMVIPGSQQGPAAESVALKILVGTSAFGSVAWYHLLGECRLGSFVWKLSFVILRLGTFTWIFRLETSAWSPSL